MIRLKTMRFLIHTYEGRLHHNYETLLMGYAMLLFLIYIIDVCETRMLCVSCICSRRLLFLRIIDEGATAYRVSRLTETLYDRARGFDGP